MGVLSKRVLAFSPPMARVVVLYALGLGLLATLLSWLEYRYLARAFSFEIYLALVAVGIGVLLRFEVALDPEARGVGSDREHVGVITEHETAALFTFRDGLITR